MTFMAIVVVILLVFLMCVPTRTRSTDDDDSSVGTHALYGKYQVVYPEIDPRTGKNYMSQRFSYEVACDYAKMFNGKVVKAR